MAPGVILARAMTFDRRLVLSTGLGLTAATAAAMAGPRKAADAQDAAAVLPGAIGLVPNSHKDQSARIQTLIDEAANRKEPLMLPRGRYRVSGLVLRSGSKLAGAHGLTSLEYSGGATLITAEKAPNILIEGVEIDGASLALDPDRADALMRFDACTDLRLRDVRIRRSLLNGLSLSQCSGTVADCTFEDHSQAAIRSLDATGLEVLHNRVQRCGNNGVQIWRTAAGEDGSIVSGNRIDEIAAKAGGSGQNGNGISVFRAGNVLVTSNRISQCAYSAIRGNAASNVQMIANSCSRLGEVALYAEFGFQGAVISSNMIEQAASGIEVTNFDAGGRLAVVQGNLIRGLKRREHEPVDKRGDGIGVEADSVVTGNVIEDAPHAGIVVGWGNFMRNCQIAQNLVRKARYGILITDGPQTGACQITANMIAGATHGAIRLMDHGRALGPDLAYAAPADRDQLSITGNLVS